MTAPEAQLIYFADPMCSWCWGFSPVVEKLVTRFQESAPVTLVLGGLRPGAADPLDARGKEVIREHWVHVAEASGQPFDHAFFEREGFVYDTEPSCRAVVAARRLDPHSAHAMLAAVHRAFYAENRDVTDEEVLADIGAQVLSLPAERFREVLTEEETKRETERDFKLSRELGITGFPSLLARRGDRVALVTRGYAPWSAIEQPVERWLEQTAAQDADT